MILKCTFKILAILMYLQSNRFWDGHCLPSWAASARFLKIAEVAANHWIVLKWLADHGWALQSSLLAPLQSLRILPLLRDPVAPEQTILVLSWIRGNSKGNCFVICFCILLLHFACVCLYLSLYLLCVFLCVGSESVEFATAVSESSRASCAAKASLAARWRMLPMVNAVNVKKKRTSSFKRGTGR